MICSERSGGIRLQWGRAHVSAEMNGSSRQHVSVVVLQWGRAHVSAEITLNALRNSSESVPLQWGRAHVSAEIRLESSAALGRPRASMGPRSRERGDSAIAFQTPVLSACFNGAALT